MSMRFMNSTMLVRLASCTSAGFSGRMSLEANSSEYRQNSFPARKKGMLSCLAVDGVPRSRGGARSTT